MTNGFSAIYTAPRRNRCGDQRLIIGGQKGWDHPYFKDAGWPPWTNFDLMDDIPYRSG